MPRKAVKRPAEKTNSDPEPKKAKNGAVSRKKDEPIEQPDLRQLEKQKSFVLTFGQNDVGQLGLGEDVAEKQRPAVLELEENIVMIEAGGMHTIMLTDEGKVITFGCNDEGALGRDTSQEGAEFIPGEVNLPGKVVQITAGDSHSAALLDDGRVYAWGSFRDSHGSMGLTTGANEKVPIELLPSVKIIKLASGADHLLLLSDEGKVYSSGCAEQGQLGRVPLRSADRGNRQGVRSLLEPALVKFSPRVKTKFNNIWAGSSSSFVQDVNNTIYVFGLNNYHQMGLPGTETQFFPTPSETLSRKNLVCISNAQHHTIALDRDGKVFALGRKEYGRLGLGPDCDDAQVLTRVDDLADKNCIDIGTGTAQSFAVTEPGQLYSWGMGTNGQLGTGNEDDVLSPLLVQGKQLEGKSVVRVSGGGQHTVILAVESKMNSHNSVKK